MHGTNMIIMSQDIGIYSAELALSSSYPATDIAGLSHDR